MNLIPVKESCDVGLNDSDGFEEVLVFGNFDTEEYKTYFTDTVKENGVEFICSTRCNQGATAAWVHEGRKLLTCEGGDDRIFVENQFANTNDDVKYRSVNGEKSKQSWASLFAGSKEESRVDDRVVISVHMNNDDDKGSIDSTVDNNRRNEHVKKLAGAIDKLSLTLTPHHLQLRGLVNRANWCYINTTLQSLLAIPPISHFYKSLKMFADAIPQQSSTPLTDSMISFFNEFELINPKIPLKKQELRTGSAFEPCWVYDVLPVMKTNLSERGRQEDAEEFLSFLLNGIHDELVALNKLVAKPDALPNGECHDDNSDHCPWSHVGPKHKESTVRKTVAEDSLIKKVFGGVIRSSVCQSGVKESTTLQPFFTLQLDIQSENIFTLSDAVESYFSRENLQGFTCSKTHAEVEASRRLLLEELPMVFIFHLKYFVYDRMGGCQKIYKAIDIPIDLEIAKEILSPTLRNKLSVEKRTYKLHAVIYHHGKHAAGGHYTSSVNHGNPFGWVNFNDNIIQTVSASQVLRKQHGCVPYLLFYEKCKQ